MQNSYSPKWTSVELLLKFQTNAHLLFQIDLTEAMFLLNATFNRYDEDACHNELLMLTLSFHSDQLQYLEMLLVSDWKIFGVNDIIAQPHCTRRYESVSAKCILNACYFIRGSCSYVISKNKNKKMRQ